MKPRLILASASPRRRTILERFGLPFEICIPDVDEVHWEDRPADCVLENARCKHDWCRTREPEAAILAADTLVLFDGKLIGKPADHAQAKAWLGAFSGRTQTVLTACAVSMPDGQTALHLDRADVTFKVLSPEAVDRYLLLVDPLDKAGGYDVAQYGRLVVDRYTGDWSTIMGLSEARVAQWLTDWGMWHADR